MSLSIPGTLKEMFLYIWKVIDLDRISTDNLINLMAFEFKISNANDCRKKIQDAIASGLISENSELEEIMLSPSLKKEFDAWQSQGKDIAKKMQLTLKTAWRPAFEISEAFSYQIYERELVDSMVQLKAKNVRASAIKMENPNFDEVISGEFIEEEITPHTSYKFEIYPKLKKINHKCPEYNNLRQGQKKFCVHLARILIKIYAQDKTRTFQLVKDIVQNKEKWQF